MKTYTPKYARAALAAGLLGFAPAAFAYLDPSTGSMILSAIVGIFATVSLALKTYWYKLKSFFGGKSDVEAEPDAAQDMEAKAENDMPS